MKLDNLAANGAILEDIYTNQSYRQPIKASMIILTIVFSVPEGNIGPNREVASISIAQFVLQDAMQIQRVLVPANVAVLESSCKMMELMHKRFLKLRILEVDIYLMINLAFIYHPLSLVTLEILN